MNDLVDGPVTVHIGHVLDVLRAMSAESVHCVITSPPYWGLRDYGTPGQLGLEPTPEEYVAKMVEVFREVRRVLRKDATLWLNLGDSYASSSTYNTTNSLHDEHGWKQDGDHRPNVRANQIGLKPKDLVGIPWRVAFALQADGWYLRSDIIWSKPNPMPESVTDRPTKAHEYLFLLTKNANYFYDAEAIREQALWPDGPNSPESIKSPYGQGFTRANGLAEARLSKKPDGWDTGPGGHGSFHRDGRESGKPSLIRTGRNKRSVWEIATQPYPEAHFATFPEDLVIPCVGAGTSEHGCCAQCGAPWERVIEKDVKYTRNSAGHSADYRANSAVDGGATRLHRRPEISTTTTGWQPTCKHSGQIVSCTVLDPFAGSGTTLAVARRLGRRSVGIELQQNYLPLIERRIKESSLPLLEML